MAENTSPVSVSTPVTEAAKEENPILLWVQVLKYSALLFSGVTFLAFFFLLIQMSPSNQYLGLFGMGDNVYTKYEKLSSQNRTISASIAEKESKMASLNDRITKKDYFLFKSQVDEIKKGKLNWFDRQEEGGQVTYGMLDAIDRVVTYFNSPQYQNPILAMGGNTVRVERVAIDAKQARFSATVSNMYEKVFYLGTEFINILDSFSFFKGGALSTFNRTESREGDTEMQFAVNLDIQRSEDKDPQDARFSEYTQWLSGQSQ